MARLEDIDATGSDKTVKPLEGNPTIVRCEFETRLKGEARGTYLLQKLAHMFFPEIVPRPLSFGESKPGRFYMDVERVALDAKHLRKYYPPFRHKEANAHELEFYDKRYEDTLEQRRKIRKQFRRAGLPFDSKEINFTLAENKIRHVDTSPPWLFNTTDSQYRTYDVQKLRAKIASLTDLKQREEAEAIFREILKIEND